MGVTIHFEGRLRDDAAYRRVVETARRFADERNWPWEPINVVETTLKRVVNEQDADYTGPVKGIALAPDNMCDPVRLEFDADLFIQEYVKTQFAGVEVHLRVVELLRQIEPLFSVFQVLDEGEYWVTQDAERLARHLDKCDEALKRILQSHPGARGPVRFPSGRIIDALT